MRRVVVIGAAGQLGSALLASLRGHAGFEAFGLDLIGPDRFDVTDSASVTARLLELRPWAVINTAAFLRVDDCEEQAEFAFRVNTLAVHHLARVCRDLDCALMHVSTDYVFGRDGGRRQPWTEADLAEPTCVYGASKLAGEMMAQAYAPRCFVVRSAGLYNLAGSIGKGTNFVETMLRVAGQNKPLKVVDDQRLTPTFTPDLAEAMVSLLKSERYGLYHATNAGECSWYEFAQEIFRQARLSPDLSPTSTQAWGAKAARPAYSVLSNAKLAGLGISPPRHWTEALADYLGRR